MTKTERSIRLRKLVGLFAGLFMLSVEAARPPEFPAPDDARVQIVSGDMKINGIAANVRHFTSEDPITEIVKFYREEWEENHETQPGYTISDINPPWLVITRIEDDYMMTVQVQSANDGGSWGFLALSRLPTRTRSPKLGEDFPSMRGSYTLNEVVSKDPGQRGRTMLLGNKHDIRTNVDFYRNRYRTEGWAFDMDKSIGGLAHVLALRKGRKRLNLVLAEAGKKGTRIVVNEVTYDIL